MNWQQKEPLMKTDKNSSICSATTTESLTTALESQEGDTTISSLLEEYQKNYRIEIGTTTANGWKVINNLGNGRFGDLYVVQHAKLHLGKVAMKIESKKRGKARNFLPMELTVLKKLQGKKHFVRLYAGGQTSDFYYVVMTLLGPNLSQLQKMMPRKKFSLTRTSKLAIQMIRAIQQLQEIGFVHRDIKPHNFALGTKASNKQDTVYLLDFGLCRKWTDEYGEVRRPRAA